jgi:hypothetical protein
MELRSVDSRTDRRIIALVNLVAVVQFQTLLVLSWVSKPCQRISTTVMAVASPRPIS